MSPLHDPEARIRRSTAPCMPGNALLGEHSVNPRLVSGVRNGVSGHEPAAQRAERPDLLPFTGSVNHRCGEADRGAHDSKQAVSLDRAIASRNRRKETPSARLTDARYGTPAAPQIRRSVRSAP